MMLSACGAPLLVLSFVSVVDAWAGLPDPSIPIGRQKEDGSQSRRDWFSGTAALFGAAVVGSSVEQPAWAVAAPAVQSRPTDRASASICDPSVSVWKQPGSGRTVYLLGTAHISSDSADLAGSVVRDTKPDAVFVELDAKRVGIAKLKTGASSDDPYALPGTNGQVLQVPPPSTYEQISPTIERNIPLTPKQSNPFDVRRKALQAGSAAVGGAIRGMYKKLDNAGFDAGAEFSTAVREGQNLGSKIVLGDRDVDVTMQRLTEALSKTDLKAILSPDSELEQTLKGLMPPSDEELLLNPTKEQLKDGEFQKEFSQYVEARKAKETVKVLMSEMKRLAPELYQAMVAERDLYMANGLDVLNQFPKIVAVMGVAHVDGVERNLSNRGWRPVPLKCAKRNMRFS